MEKLSKPSYGPPKVEKVDEIIHEFIIRAGALDRAKEMFRDEMNTKIVDFAASRLGFSSKWRGKVHERTKRRVAEVGVMNEIDVSEAIELLEPMWQDE
jgi:hypothetical protein